MLKNTEGEKYSCYIEALPDEILEDILSRLKTREAAARTCMVSRRWRNLCLNLLTCCRNLDLDFTEKKHKFKYIQESLACVLFNKHKSDVDNMRIAFHHDYSEPAASCLHCTFSEWLLLANDKRVQSLEFHVESSQLLQHPPGCGHNKFTGWERKERLKPWERLASLSLKSVLVNKVDLHQLLHMCPNLETLLLENVPIKNIYTLMFNPKLKRLEIRNCAVSCTIQVQTLPSLESFKHIPLRNKLNGHGMRFLGECHTPKLEEVSLGGRLCRYIMQRLHEDVPRLQKLQLDMDVKCDDFKQQCYCWKWGVNFQTLGNVKQLELRFTSTQEDDHDTRQMDTAITIIRVCPCLEKLTLKYEIQRGDDVEEEDYDHLITFSGENECLRAVQVLGWSGLKSEVRFIRYLIHSSPNLQDMLLDPTTPHHIETSWCGVFGPVEKSENEIEYAVRAAQQLTDYLHKLAK